MLMRRLILFLFVFSLIPVPSQAKTYQVSWKEWGTVLEEIGIRPGETMTEKKWDKQISRLVKFSKKVRRIQASAEKQITLEDWISMLVKKKIEPKKNMTKDEWRLILSVMGADLPVEVFVSLPAEPELPGPVLSSTATAGVLPEVPGAEIKQPQVKFVHVDKMVSPRVLELIEVSSNWEEEEKSSVSTPISLEFRNMDIVDVLKILSSKSRQNIIVGKNVKGKITLFLKNVNFWEALKQILDTHGLAYIKEDDIIKVISAQDYEREYGVRFGDKTIVKIFKLQHVRAGPAKKMLESFKSKVGKILINGMTNSLIVVDVPKQMAMMEKVALNLDIPSETRVFKLNYAKVENLLPKVQPLVSKEFGRIESDKRSNTILVTDGPEGLAAVARVIEAFDVRPKVVLIEAKIVQILLNDNFQWGVNWEYVFNRINSRNLAGTILGTLQLLPTGSLTKDDASKKGITATVGSIQANDFTATLNLLDSVGTTNLLSSPRISVINNEEARIHVGTREAFVTTTVVNPGDGPVTTAEKVTFVDVGVKLYVTPTIGNDGFVTMKIRPEVSSVDRTLSTAQGNAIPIVRTSEAETSVIVKDGVTIVIGGLIEEKEAEIDNRVPILGWIPILGLLFRSKSRTIQKTELVIFLTPHIITGDVKSPETEVYLDRGSRKG